MKKIINASLTGLIFLLIFAGCSKTVIIEEEKLPSVRTAVATVLSQKGVLVGEFEDGPRIIDRNITEKILTWQGFHLILRTEDGGVYEYLSHDLYYEGDRVLIRIQNGKVISLKNSP